MTSSMPMCCIRHKLFIAHFSSILGNPPSLLDQIYSKYHPEIILPPTYILKLSSCLPNTKVKILSSSPIKQKKISTPTRPSLGYHTASPVCLFIWQSICANPACCLISSSSYSIFLCLFIYHLSLSRKATTP